MLGGLPASIRQAEASPGIIYVPDDYTKIQWAVDNATSGDTIIVRDDTYGENTDMNKNLALHSDNETVVSNWTCNKKGIISLSMIEKNKISDQTIFGISGETFFVSLKLLSIPSTLAFDRDFVPDNLMEYEWSIYIDSDNNPNTGSSGIHFPFVKGCDVSVSLMNFKFPNSTQHNATIIEGTQHDTWIYEGNDCWHTGHEIDAAVDYPNNTIKMMASKAWEELSNVDENSRFCFVTSCYTPDGVMSDDTSFSSGSNIITDPEGDVSYDFIDIVQGNLLLSKTWYVDDDLADYPSADFTRIQEAVDNATSGDTIIVYPGTYIENVDVNKDHLTIESENGPEVTIVHAANPDDHVFEITASNVAIIGCTAEGANALDYYKAGIHLYYAQDCLISHTICQDNSDGIQLYYSSNNILRNNACSGNYYGLHALYSPKNTLEHNTWSAVDFGIFLERSSETVLRGNILQGCGLYVTSSNDNEVDDCWVNNKPLVYLEDKQDVTTVTEAGQVILVNCRNIEVSNCELSAATIGVMLIESSNCKIQNNTCSQNHQEGILLVSSSYNTLENNTCFEDFSGILLVDSLGNAMENNTCWGNREGIYLAYSSNNALENNKCSGNDFSGIRLNPSSNYNIVKDNTCSANEHGIELCDSSDNKIYLNNFVDNEHNVYSENSTNIWNSPEEITYTYNGTIYTSYLGNYWSDYVGNDANGDGIGDTPYSIDSDNDNYPLVEPFENYEVVPAPYPVITSPLEITPKDIYYVGDDLIANFTITNRGTESVTFDVLTVGGRLNGWCPAEGCPDFTHRAITLQPAELYQYEGALTLTHAGNYHFFIAYYIENPTPEEKKLLDENNWNTCVYLAEGLAHADRVKNVIVLEEPDTVAELRDRINDKFQWQVQYPPYLLDPNSFTSAVATLWAEFTSWITQTHLTEKYDELYQAGIDYDCLSLKALIDARNSLDRGDIVSAEKYLQRSYTYDRLSAMSFGAAAEVFEGNLEAGEILAKGIKDGCEASVKFGLGVTNPTAAKAADYIYIGVDYAIDRVLVGEEEATKNAIINAAVTTVFNEVKFKDLGDRTIADYTKNRIGKVTFPMLQEALQNNDQLQFLVSKAIKECGVEIEEEVAEDIVTGIMNELERAINLQQAKVESPVELRVRDSQADTTGLLNGEVEHGISRSVYCGGTVTTFFPSDAYRYEVVGINEGLYGLEVTSIEDGNATTIAAVDVPTSVNATHNYTINWTALFQGGKAVTIEIDSDGDGVVDETVFTTPPDVPSSPSPSDSAANILVDIVLNWTGGDPDGDNVTYKVYFGTDENPPLVSDNQTETSYSPSLEYGTKYYWRVVARDEHGIATEGPVWQFTTVGATLEGQINFSGRGSPPCGTWIEDFVVRGFEPGNLTNELWTENATTNASGVFIINGITPGTYDIGIKNWTCLSELNTSVTLNAGETTVVNFGMTREGDSNNDDIITGADRSLLYSGWGKSQGEAGYDIHYDFNRDGSLGGPDRSLMYANWGQHGDLV